MSDKYSIVDWRDGRIYTSALHIPKLHKKDFSKQRRKKRIFAQILTALKERQNELEMFKFLTVTTSPNSKGHNDIEELRQCWKEFVRRIRRRYGIIEYLAVVEQNKKKNLFHIHAIVYAPYIPQSEISEIWKQITGAYIVFVESLFIYEHSDSGVRKIPLKDMKVIDYQKVLRTAAGYIAKYVGKEGVQRRTWVSRHFSERWRKNRKLYQMGKCIHIRTTGKEIYEKTKYQRVEYLLRFYKWAKVINPQYLYDPETGKAVKIGAMMVLNWMPDRVRITRWSNATGKLKVWYIPVYDDIKEEGELDYLLEDPEYVIQLYQVFDALANAPPDILPA